MFIRGIKALPRHILRNAVLEKYASAERSRLQLLLATWDLEETRRRVQTQEQILCFLETTHALTESEYKLWLEMYTDRGLPELKEDQLIYGNHIPYMTQAADRDRSELAMMIQHARECGIGLGSFEDELKGDDAGSDADSIDLGEDVASDCK